MRHLTAQIRNAQQARTRAETHCFSLELRDGTTVYRWTTHDKPVTLLGEDYSADFTYAPGVYAPYPGLEVSRIELESAIRGNSAVLKGAILDDDSEGITADQVRARLVDSATLRHWVVHWRDPTICFRHDVYEVASVTTTDTAWDLDLVGRPARRLAKRFGASHKAQCENDLGVDDGRTSFCAFDTTRPVLYKDGTFSAVATGRQITGTGIETGLAVGDTIQFWGFVSPDMTAAFTVEALGTNAITVDRDIPNEAGDGNEILIRVGYVDALISAIDGGDSRRVFTVTSAALQTLQMTENWFQRGRVEFLVSTPANRNDRVKEAIQASTAATLPSPNTQTTLTLYNAVPFPLTLGHAVRLVPGCDLLPQTCIAKFGQLRRYTGNQNIPGADKALKTAGSA